MKAASIVLCNNILRRGIDDNIAITPMKLQKLMYYVCRDYVHTTGQMPIGEEFEVWQYGPVLPSVYAEFKSFGARPITCYAKDANGEACQVSEKKNPVLTKVLDRVWAEYKNFSGIELSQKTHQKGSGWYRAYLENREKISLEDMRNDSTN